MPHRRNVLTGAGALALSGLAPGAASAARLSDPAPPPGRLVTRIALGSCLRRSDEAEVLDHIAARRPDAMLWLGDNVYADTIDMTAMKEKYARLGTNPRFRRLAALCPNLATWDDHDYGKDNAGSDYPMRRESRDQFFDFWGVDPRSPRRWHDGVYGAWVAGPRGREVQIILLDNRFNKTPKPSATGSLLGETQWRWLDQQLARPAAVRIVASGIQILNDDNPRPERWADYPQERERLFALLRRRRATGVVFASGDTHYCELSRARGLLGYDAVELTTSALDQPSSGRHVPRRQRIGEMTRDANFGLIEIDWHSEDPVIKLELHPADGGSRPFISHWVRLGELRPPAAYSRTL